MNPVPSPAAATRRYLLVVALVSLLTACTGGGAGGRDSEPRLAYVARVETGAEGAPPTSSGAYVLRSLEDSTRHVRFDFYGSEAEARRAGGADVYRLLLRTPGPAPTPTHAVFAEWQLEDVSSAAPFERSRAALFELRAEHLEGFHADLLLQALDEPARYLILGLYAGEEGLRQARGHSRIRAFAEENPPARFGARDLYGVRNFRLAAPR